MFLSLISSFCDMIMTNPRIMPSLQERHSSYLSHMKIILVIVIVTTLVANITVTKSYSSKFWVATESGRQFVNRIINSTFGKSAEERLVDKSKLLVKSFNQSQDFHPIQSPNPSQKMVTTPTENRDAKDVYPSQSGTPDQNMETNVKGSSKNEIIKQSQTISRPPIGPGESHVTYDPSVIVRCPKRSPYIFCNGIPAKRAPEEQAADARKHPPFKIALIRGANWLPSFDFSRCSYNNCINAGKTPQPDTNHIHVHGVGLNDRFPMPKHYANHTWSFGVWESPHHSGATAMYKPQSPWHHKFNMIMSYRVDSDVFVPYSFLGFEPIPLKMRPNYMQIAKNKPKMVAWLVSNCNTPSRRMEYVKQLKKYIKVDIYGGCGKPCRQSSTDNFMCSMDQSLYKFYLSFENSICTDYITEKTFKIYSPDMHVIPVTRGGANYTNYFPPDTYINADDFKGPQQLAEYLKNLSSDLPRYARMLEQKDMYRRFSGHHDMWCSLCEALNTKTVPKTIHDVQKFWEGHCIRR